MDGLYNILLIANLFIGVYFLFCGFLKKGGIYRNDYPKEIKADVAKSLSVMAILAGFVLVFGSMFEIMSIFNKDIVVYLSSGICLAIIIGYVIYFKKRFGKYLR